MHNILEIIQQFFVASVGASVLFGQIVTTPTPGFPPNVPQSMSVPVFDQSIGNRLPGNFVERVRNLATGDTYFLNIKGESFASLVANSGSLREKGLSGSVTIGEREAMLFVFDRPDRYAFWMKDMKYAIDIIWLNEKGEIVHIVHSATPESYPEAFRPKKDAIAVIEIKAGISKTLGLVVGDFVILQGR